MKKSMLIGVILLSIILFTSCSKSIEKKIVGEWESNDGFKLQFNSDSTATISILYMNTRDSTFLVGDYGYSLKWRLEDFGTDTLLVNFYDLDDESLITNYKFRIINNNEMTLIFQDLDKKFNLKKINYEKISVKVLIGKWLIIDEDEELFVFEFKENLKVNYSTDYRVVDFFDLGCKEELYELYERGEYEIENSTIIRLFFEGQSFNSYVDDTKKPARGSMSFGVLSYDETNITVKFKEQNSLSVFGIGYLADDNGNLTFKRK